MSVKSVSLVVSVLLAVCSIPTMAQDKLGDLVAEYGYDWMIGKWAATDDNGRQVELEYKWILDKCAMCVNVKRGDFNYHGLIMFMPSKEEVVQLGADNMGGTWNGTWAADYEGTFNRNERLDADGTTETMDMFFIKVDNDSFRVKEYSVESGTRAAQARGETMFRRQKEQTARKVETGSELDGTWVGADAGGYGGQWTFVISKGKVEVKGPESDYYAGTMKLNDKTSPGQIDFKIDKCSIPEYVDETSLGIYKLEGNKLTLATSEPGSMYRPAFFDSSGGVMLFSLTRE